MSIVPDLHDSQGMFSKAGRFTSEKYIIFSKKDEIMYNKPRYVKGNMMPDIPEKKENTQRPQTKSVEVEKKHKKHESQPFTKQLSRDKSQKVHLDKNQPPPCGYYHPKYSEIDPNSHHVFDYQKTLLKTPSRLVRDNKEPEPFEQVPERMRWSHTCLYELKRQKERGNLFKNMPQPHEKRFEMVKVNEAWSKVPRVAQVPMNKTLSRDQMIIYKRKNYAPDYDPNFEYGRRGLGSCGAKFEKNKERGNLWFKPCHYTNETIFEWDKYSKSPNSIFFKQQILFLFFQLFFDRPVTPDFDRMLTREANSNSKLPSFMMTLTHVHEKMLEVNNYGSGRFQTVTTGFGVHKKQKKQEQSFSEEEMDEIEYQE